jgi:hypothetical protein
MDIIRNKTGGTKVCVLTLTNIWKKTLQFFKEENTFVVAVQRFDLVGDGKVNTIEVYEQK